MSPNKIFTTQIRTRSIQSEYLLKPSGRLMQVFHNGTPKPYPIWLLVNQVPPSPVYLLLDASGRSYTAIGERSNDFIASIEDALVTHPEATATLYGVRVSVLRKLLNCHVPIVIVEWGPDQQEMIDMLALA